MNVFFSRNFKFPLTMLVYACLDTCCSDFLTIIAGVDLNFRHESELPVCRTRGLNPGVAANHYTNDACFLELAAESLSNLLWSA